jgi:multidrug efflux pump subunit AcrB
MLPQFLAAATLLALAVCVASWPSAPLREVTDPPAPLSITLEAADLRAPVTDLADRTEALRAALLTVPGVGEVRETGLQQVRLFIDATPARLRAFGLTEADLAASVPLDPTASTPGHLAVNPSASQAGLQAVLNLPVRAGGRVFRLGDVALVSRARLDPPVSTLLHAGRPAVELTIVPAPGADHQRLAADLAAFR